MASGLDSLAGVELQNVLQASYPVSLPATLALDYPSVSAIAGYIHSKLAAVAVAVGAAAPGRAAAVRQQLPRVTAATGAEPLGVYGMALVLPGAAGGLGRWQGQDAIGVVPLERWVMGGVSVDAEAWQLGAMAGEHDKQSCTFLS
jgi:hypothetical protein